MSKRGNPNITKVDKTPTTGGVNSSFEDSFYNAAEPTGPRSYEKPWHRVATFLYAQGKTFEEIGKSLGYAPTTVAIVVKQPWAQERLIRETTEAGRDNLQAIYDCYGPNTLLEVIDLGKSAKSENVQLEAKKYFLNRWLGMPKESMMVSNKPSETKTDDELRASVNTILDSFSRPPGVPDPAAG